MNQKPDNSRAAPHRKTAMVAVRFTPEELDRLEAYADDNFLSRSEAIREAVTSALDAAGVPQG